TKGALYLLFASAGLSLIYMIGSDEIRAQLLGALGASGQSVWGELKLWQLVTSALLEVQLVSLLFQAFALWMFLPALERWWGMKRFLLFALYTSVAGITAGTLVGWLLGGASALHLVSGLDPFVFAGIEAGCWAAPPPSTWCPASTRSCSPASSPTASCSRTSGCSSSASCR